MASELVIYRLRASEPITVVTKTHLVSPTPFICLSPSNLQWPTSHNYTIPNYHYFRYLCLRLGLPTGFFYLKSTRCYPNNIIIKPLKQLRNVFRYIKRSNHEKCKVVKVKTAWRIHIQKEKASNKKKTLERWRRLLKKNQVQIRKASNYRLLIIIACTQMV